MSTTIPPSCRHNELWGKKAPSRLHPLQRSRKCFHSEPSLVDCGTESSVEPELSFLPEEDLPLMSHDPLHSSLSLFPLDPSLPVDKHEHIRNFLASLPPVVIDDDQGIGDIPYTSESGSGYSTPNLSPTDNDHFDIRVQKLLSRKGRSDSVGSNTHTSAEAKREAAKDKEIKSEGEVTCNTHTEASPTSEHGVIEERLSDAEIKQPVVNQIPFTIKTIGRDSVSVPGSVEPSSLSPNPSSNISVGSQSPQMEEVDFENPTLFRLGSPEPEMGSETTPEAAGTIQSTQIQSVPERVKEIEKLSSLTDLSPGVKTEATNVVMPLIISRDSSVYSQLSACDQELVQLEVAEPSPPHHITTRHESLSPSPPTRRLTEHVRHSSLVNLPSSNKPSVKCDSEDVLGSSLRGAVRARILDIEEKKGQDVELRKSSISDASARSSSPTGLKSEQLPRRPASVAVDDPSGKPCMSHDIQNHAHQYRRRESTPPAVFSAWSTWISHQDLPPPPVQDLKRKFEDSYSEGSKPKIGGVLRRSQSLRNVDPPRRISRGPRTSSPEQSRRHGN